MKRRAFWCAYIALIAALLAAGGYTMNCMRLDKGLPFEAYFAKGTPEQQARQTERIGQTAVSQHFIDSIKKIETPLVVVAVAGMKCPDCTIVTPFLLAMEKANPNITVRFFELTRTQKNRLLLRTREARIPTVFLSTPGGRLYKGSFAERPQLVKALTQKAGAEDEKKQIVQDFRSGKYNAEIEKDLLALFENALNK